MNYKHKVKKIIQTLSQWSKKPSLEQDISGLLDKYYSIINHGEINFAETAIIIQAYSCILEKRIDILFKEFFALSLRLCSALRRPEEEQQIDIDTQPITEQIQVENVQTHPVIAEENHCTEDTNNVEKPPEKVKRKRKKTLEESNESFKKRIIASLPNELLESINLADCNMDEVIKECLSKVSRDHPLYALFAKYGDEVSRTKDFITYNDISLSGKSWNILYILENILNKNNTETIEESATTQNTVTTTVDSAISSTNTLASTQISENGLENISSMYGDSINTEITEKEQEDSGVCSSTSVNANNTETGNNFDDDSHTENSNNATDSVDESSAATSCENSSNVINDKSISNEELRKIVTVRNNVEIKNITLNLLRLPLEVLLKEDYFRLTTEYFSEMKKKQNERKINKLIQSKKKIEEKKIKNPKQEEKLNSRKRQREREMECLELVKKLKTYDLDQFEEFCYSYNVSQGICPPIPEKLCSNRKSVDNRSDMSYGDPVTPDSGRFSMSFHTDSEFEHTDFDIDHESDHRRTSSRADSGFCPMSPLRGSHIDSELPYSSEPVTNVDDPYLTKLKSLFPNSFADPQRAELLKNLVRPPEEERETENYSDWKSYINKKTANELEFNIHEYGTEILNAFPSKTKNEVISFKTVVQNKSVGDVARYFVSALQLANTYNIDICDSRTENVRAEGFNIKFLSEERQHEELDDFSAPSENNPFFRSLPSASSGFPYNLHSTPSTSFSQQKHHNHKKPEEKRRLNNQCFPSLPSTSSGFTHNRHSTPRTSYPEQIRQYHKKPEKRRRLQYTY